MSIETPLKVLFFSQDGKLGDAIVNTAFVAGLLRADPACEIHATVSGVTARFWGADRRIAKLWMVKRPGWREVIRTGLALRRERYDFIVPWRRLRSERNRALLLLAGAGAVIDLRAFHQGAVRHQIESCAAALAQIRPGRHDELAYALAPTEKCAGLDALLPPDQDIIVVNLFAADAWRTVGAREGAEMLRGLRAIAPSAALCLVCTDPTAAAARAVLADSGVAGLTINCEGSLERLFDLCRRAALVISPDTAPVHIASAFDTPVIGIYQNDGVKAVRWAPRSRARGVVLSASADSVAGFSVGRVLELARELTTRRSEEG